MSNHIYHTPRALIRQIMLTAGIACCNQANTGTRFGISTTNNIPYRHFEYGPSFESLFMKTICN